MTLSDPATFERAYDQHARGVYRAAYRVLGSAAQAQDVVQDVFLKLWRQPAKFDARRGELGSYLRLMSRSRALDLLRRQRADRAQLTQEFDETMADTLESDAANPMDTADASEQAWALHQCLAQLENKQREVLSLAYLRDLSHGDLAAQLKLPLGTVKTWIRRGLDKLRICMARFA